nr:hypothetical protein [uncultured Fibrobacter sp.]
MPVCHIKKGESRREVEEKYLYEIANVLPEFNNQLINDGCGLFRGRQILPFEHLSRFQNDLVD